MVLQPLRAPTRTNILDVGPAMPQTLAFFSGFNCRLHVADLLDAGIVAHQHHLNEQELAAHFARALFMIDAPLDICLLWDFPNHLALPAAQAFNRVLRRFIKPETLAHGFCSVKRTRPTMRHRYAILRPNEVLRQEDAGIPPAAHPYPQKQLVDALCGFAFERGALRDEGRVEIMLRSATPDDAAKPEFGALGSVRPAPGQSQAARRPRVANTNDDGGFRVPKEKSPLGL